MPLAAVLPPVALVAWNPAGPRIAVNRVLHDLPAEFRGNSAFGMVVHGTCDQLLRDGAALHTQVQSEGIASVLFEVAGDVSTDDQQRREAVCQLAASLHHPVIYPDLEARWKLGQPGFDGPAALAWIDASERAGVAFCLSTYPRPTSHNDPTEHYPWKVLRAVDAYLAQEYQTGATLAQAKEGLRLHVLSWIEGRDDGLVSSAPVFGELPAGGSPAACLMWVASWYERAVFWVGGCDRADDPTSLDADGLLTMRVLLALVARGFKGRGALDLFQARTGLTPDGVLGPKTLAALGL